ncbi:MAG: M48 family metallopeptidase [Nanoarchaeota archaeon]|jgi:predicted metal-dependent hydrolase|nr:M48 family metallopeptidase [Nanoarchaeota archaeon]
MGKETTKITIDGKEYNVNIYSERRNSVRGSVTKSGINIRMPSRLGPSRREAEVRKLVVWGVGRIRENPRLRVDEGKVYSHLDVINVFDKNYVLHIELRDSVKNFVKVQDGRVEFKIVRTHSEEARQEYISKQLRRLLAVEYKQWLVERTSVLNERYFEKDIGSVSFKYTKARWGVCKYANKEINLSTRLLLAPVQVVDYVIIHELAHLVEPNHSRAFWDIVRKADPNYKNKVKWLKMYGHKLVL